MRSVVNVLFFATVFYTFFCSLHADENAEHISVKTSVIFNTLCAKCHEGQCSGRLSFKNGIKATTSHIQRYAEDINVSESETKGFFALLEHMKKECSLLMPDDGKWQQKNLSRFALPSREGYFIPLGLLKEGQYRLYLETEEKIPFRVEVISERFDPFLDRSLFADHKAQELLFTIDEPISCFLRIRSRKPLQLIGLEIKRDR